MRKEAKVQSKSKGDGQANGAAGNLEQEREQTVKERTAISAQIVYEAILAEGEEELQRSTSALAFSGLAAGLSMGFSFITQGYLEAALPQGELGEVVGKLGYSMGFLIVILGRQQLFTENTLTPIIPLLKHKRWETLLMTYVIALGSFPHVVAGSVDTFYLVVLGDKTWGEYLWNFMLPTLLGNIIGGVALVAALNHAQVTAGKKE